LYQDFLMQFRRFFRFRIGIYQCNKTNHKHQKASANCVEGI
jgi:hypothetical protein